MRRFSVLGPMGTVTVAAVGMVLLTIVMLPLGATAQKCKTPCTEATSLEHPASCTEGSNEFLVCDALSSSNCALGQWCGCSFDIVTQSNPFKGVFEMFATSSAEGFSRGSAETYCEARGAVLASWSDMSQVTNVYSDGCYHLANTWSDGSLSGNSQPDYTYNHPTCTVNSESFYCHIKSNCPGKKGCSTKPMAGACMPRSADASSETRDVVCKRSHTDYVFEDDETDRTEVAFIAAPMGHSDSNKFCKRLSPRNRHGSYEMTEALRLKMRAQLEQFGYHTDAAMGSSKKNKVFWMESDRPYILAADGKLTKQKKDTRSRLPFVCTRTKRQFNFELQIVDVSLSGKICIKGLRCRVRITLPVPVSRHYTRSDSPLTATMRIEGGPFAEPIVRSMSVSQGNTQSSWYEFDAPETIGTAQISWQTHSGSGYRRFQQRNFKISDYFATFINNWGEAPVRTLYQGQKITSLDIERTTKKQNPSVSLCCSDYYYDYAQSKWSDNIARSFEFRVKSDAPVNALAPFWFVHGGSLYNATSVTYYFNIKERKRAILYLKSPVAIAGVETEFGVSVHNDEVVNRFEFGMYADGGCYERLLHEEEVAWEVGESNNVTVLNTPDEEYFSTTRTCTIYTYQLDWTYQFLRPEATTVLVRPKLNLRVSGLPSSNRLSTDTAYTFSVSTVHPGETTPTFWYGSVSVTVSCGVASFSPSTVALSTTTPSASVTLTTGSSTGDCAIDLTWTGSSEKHVNDWTKPTFEVVELGQLTWSVPRSAFFVGETVAFTVGDTANKLPSGTSATVTWSVSCTPSGALGATTTGSVTVSDTQRLATVSFTVAAAGSCSVTFSVTSSPSNIEQTSSALAIESSVLHRVTSTTIPSNFSLGEAYAVKVRYSIPARPSDGSVTVTPAVDTRYITADPTSITWSSGDTTSDPKDITFIATASSDPASTATTAVVTTTSSDFFAETLTTGATVTYERARITKSTVAPPNNGGAHIVYLVAGARLRIDYRLSEALPDGMTSLLEVSAPSVSGQFAVTAAAAFTPGGTTGQLVIRPEAVSPTSSPYSAEVALVNVTERWTSWLGYWLEPTVGTLTFEVRAPLVLSAVCNATELFVGTGNAVECNVSVPALPESGAGTVQVSIADVDAFGFGFDASLRTFTPPQRWVTFTVTPPTDSVTFADQSTRDLRFTASDTSSMFDTTVQPTRTVTLRQLYQVELALVGTEAEILPMTPFVVSLTLPVASTVTVAPVAPDSGITFNVSTVELSGAGAVVHVSVMSTTVRAFELEWSVSGDVTYSATTMKLAISMPTPPQLSLASTTFGTGTTDPTTFVGQTRSIVVQTPSSNPIPLGMTLSVTLAFNCSGTVDESKVTFASTTVALTNGSLSEATNLTALATCASGRVWISSLSGSAQYHYRVSTPQIINIIAQKEVHAWFGSSRVYAGGVNKTTFHVSVNAPPSVAGQAVELLLSMQNGDALKTALAASYSYSSAGVLSTLLNIEAADAVDAVTRVTLTLSPGGPAATEYTIATPTVFVDVHPTLNVSFTDALVTKPVLYIGETVTVRASLPEAPLNDGGTVEVVARFEGAPSAIRIVPERATLSASVPFADFAFTALETASGSEYVTFTFPAGGTAHQYYPQAAARQWPVTFKQLAKVTIGTVPDAVFSGLTATVDVSITEMPPSGYSNVRVTGASASTTHLTVDAPGHVEWVAGSTGEPLTKRLTIRGGAIRTTPTNVTFGLSGPSIVSPTLNTEWWGVVTRDARAIVITLPPYVYETLTAAGTVELAKEPASGMLLDLDYILSTQSIALSLLPRPMSFTSSSATRMEVQVSGLVVEPSVTITFARENDGGAYDTPAPHTMEVRALEQVVVSELPAKMYVGTQATVRVRLSRLPQCANSEVSVAPTFGTTDASFTPESKKWLSSDDAGSLETSFLLTASTTTVSAVPVTFGIASATCRQIYEANARQPVSGVHVLPKEVVSFELPSNMSDGDGGFTYLGNDIELRVSLGTPALPHGGVTVSLGFSGAPNTLNFSATEVRFAAGEHEKTVALTGLAVSEAFGLTASVTEGAFAFDVPAGLPKVRVLPRIPVRLNFDPTTTLLVANVSRDIQFEVTESTALVGRVTVSLTFGPELNITNSVDIQPNTPSSFKYFSVTGVSPSDPKDLRVVLSGPAAGFYEVLTPTIRTQVLRQRWVEVSSSPAFAYVGAPNAQPVVLRLASAPTLADDNVFVTLTSSTGLSWSVGSVVLTTAAPNVTVSVTGLVSGTTVLADFMSASSLSREFAPKVLVATSAQSSVEVRNKLRATLQDYVGTIYAERSITFNITIPLAPLSGSLGVEVVLAQAGYALVSTPSVVWFNGTESPQTRSVTLTAPESVLPQTGLTFEASGSPEYETVVASQVVQVILQDQIGFAGWPATLYPGSANAREFAVSVSRLPKDDHQLTITPTSSAGNTTLLTFEPARLVFNATSALSYTVRVLAAALPYGTAREAVSFGVNDTETYYDPNSLPQVSVDVKAYENVTSSIDQAVIFRLETLTISLGLSVAPTEDMTIAMRVRKNSTGASQTMVDVPSSEAFVAASSVYVTGLTSAEFTVRADAAPLSALIEFEVTGPGAAVFQTRFLSSYLVRFVPLRRTTVSLPSTVFRGLKSTLAVAVERAPDAGGVIGVDAVLSPELNASSSPSFEWSTTGVPTQQTFDFYPSTIGTAQVQFTLTQVARGFENQLRPTTILETLVTRPSEITLTGIPTAAFVAQPVRTTVAERNALTLTAALSDELAEGEQVFVQLTSNVSLAISPTAEIDLSQGRAIWTVFREGAPTVARLTVLFRSTVNRWVLAADIADGVVVNFRPLKKIQVVEPAKTRFIVNEPFEFAVSVEERPQPGASLLAGLEYGGSPTNLQLPSTPAQWTSETTSLGRQLQAKGLSPTAPETLRVVFSNDPTYELTAHELRGLQIDPLFVMKSRVASSVFLNDSVELVLTNDERRVLDVELVSEPTGALGFSPAVLSFVKDESGVAPRELRARVTGLARGRASVKFELRNGEASKYNAMVKQGVEVVATGSVLIDAPSSNMIAYLGTRGVEVTVRLPEAPSVPLNVTPTFSSACGTGFARFTVPVLEFLPGQATSRSFEIQPVRENEACALQFPVTASPDGYKSPSRLFTVQVRPLHNVSVADSPQRLFPGDANKALIAIALDADTPLPLDYAVNVTFGSLNPGCVEITPSTVLWAAGNELELRQKVVFVRAPEQPGAACMREGDGSEKQLGVSVVGSAPSARQQLNLPAQLRFTMKPLLKVTAREPGFTSTEYYVFTGAASLSFAVTIAERLGDGEQMEIAADFGVYQAKISSNKAVWSGPESALTQYIVVEGVEIAPRSALNFRVVSGPARFERLVEGSGYLEVFGPLAVSTDLSQTLVAGRQYTVKVTVQDRPFPGETLVIRPRWEGRAASLSFEPSELTWVSNTMTLQQVMVLTTHEVSGAYMLDVQVSGSTRFVTTAFQNTVAIVSPTVIETRGVPLQMMVGRTYTMTVDVQQLPAAKYDFIRIQASAQRYNSLDCVVLSANEMQFTSTDSTASTTQTINLRVARVCPERRIVFRVGGNASLEYNRTIVPRVFETVAPAPVGISWPVESYVGPVNRREAFMTLYRRPAGDAALSVLITGVCNQSAYLPACVPDVSREAHCACPYGVNASRCNTTYVAASDGSDVVAYTQNVTWHAGDFVEQPVSVEGVAAGECVFSFRVVTSDTTYGVAELADVRMSVWPLVEITRGTFPATIYTSQANQAGLRVRLSRALQQPAGEATKSVRLRPVSNVEGLVFQPPVMEWLPGTAEERELFVWSRVVSDGANVTFVVEGDAASVVSSVPTHVFFTVIPLLLVTYTAPPALMYVNEANAPTVELTAPNSTEAMTVTVVVDGDPNAIQPVPRTVTWEPTSNRTQSVRLVGQYGTSVPCRLRYLLTGPSYIAVAFGAALQQVELRSQIPISRSPSAFTLYVPEQTYGSLSLVFTHFNESGIHCESTSNVTRLIRNEATQKMDVHADEAGRFAISCAVENTIYSTPSTFIIVATKKKTIAIPAPINAYVGLETEMLVALSAQPSEGTELFFAFDSTKNFRFLPTTLKFTPTTPRLQALRVLGTNATDGKEVSVVPRMGAGIPDEYRVPSFVGTRVIVRERVRVFVDLLPRSSRVTSDNGTLVGFIGEDNGIRLRVGVTETPINGGIRVIPRWKATDGRVGFSAPDIIFTTIASAPLLQTFSVLGTAPAAADIWFEAIGPRELETERVELGSVRLRPLEKFVVNTSTWPGRIFIGTTIPLRLQITGFPGAGKTADIRPVVSPAGSVRFNAPYISFASDFDNTDARLEKDLLVTGITPAASVTITFSVFERAGKATNFEPTVSSPSTLTFPVMRPMSFRVVDPTSGHVVTRTEFFNSEGRGDNFVMLRVRPDGLPSGETVRDNVVVNITASEPGKVVILPAPAVLFTKSGPAFRDIKVYGLTRGLENVTLTFTLTGPSEYAKSATRTVALGILGKLDFETIGVPTFLAAGITNTRTISVRPAPLPASLGRDDNDVLITAEPVTTRGTNCLGVEFSVIDRLDWTTRTWRRLSLRADQATPGPCRTFLQIVGKSVDSSRYIAEPFSVSFQVYTPPDIAFSAPLVSGGQIRAGYEVKLSISGPEVFAFNSNIDQTFGTSNATILVGSSLPDLPSGAVARMRANPKFVTFVEYDETERIMTLKVGPDPGYTTSRRETIRLTVTSGAMLEQVTPRNADATFTVEGERASLVGSTETAVIANGAGAAAVLGSGMSLGAATSAGKIEAILTAFNCPNPDWKADQEEYEWYQALIPVSFGSNDDLGTFAAQGFSAVLVTIVFAVIHCGIAAIVWNRRNNGPYHDKSFKAALAIVRFPSMELIPVLFLYQNVVEASLKVVMYSPSASMRMVGATTLVLFGFGVPIFIFTRVGPAFKADWTPDDADEDEIREMSLFRRLVRRTGYWDNPEWRYWVLRNGLFFDDFRQGWHKWLLFDVLMVLVLGVLEGIVPETRDQCKVKMIIANCIFAAQFLLTVVVRPFRYQLGNILFVLAFGIQFIAMTIITDAYFKDDAGTDAISVAAKGLMLFMALVLIKTAADCIFIFSDWAGLDKVGGGGKKDHQGFRKPTEEEEDADLDELTGDMRRSLQRDVERIRREQRTGQSQRGPSHDVDDDFEELLLDEDDDGIERGLSAYSAAPSMFSTAARSSYSAASTARSRRQRPLTFEELEARSDRLQRAHEAREERLARGDSFTSSAGGAGRGSGAPRAASSSPRREPRIERRVSAPVEELLRRGRSQRAAEEADQAAHDAASQRRDEEREVRRAGRMPWHPEVRQLDQQQQHRPQMYHNHSTPTVHVDTSTLRGSTRRAPQQPRFGSDFNGDFDDL